MNQPKQGLCKKMDFQPANVGISASKLVEIGFSLEHPKML